MYRKKGSLVRRSAGRGQSDDGGIIGPLLAIGSVVGLGVLIYKAVTARRVCACKGDFCLCAES